MVKINIVTLYLIFIMLSGCFLIFRQPRKRSFKYYDKKFVPDLKTSKLRVDGFYTTNKFWPWVRDAKDGCDFMYFNENAKVIEIYTSCDARKEFIKNLKSENFGFYKLINSDSIQFTTQAFYRKAENESIGKILNDTIILNTRAFNGKTFKDTFYFRPW